MLNRFRDHLPRILQTPGMMSEEELVWIAETVANVSSWTEVGVYCGRSATAAALALPPGGLLQLVDIDFRSRFYPNLEWILRVCPDIGITLCSATSVKASDILSNTDGVFIDDLHTYEGVSASIKAWQDRCRIVSGHDYDDRPDHIGVRRVVDELWPTALHPAGNIWVRP